MITHFMNKYEVTSGIYFQNHFTAENRPLLYTEQRQHTQYLLEKTVNSMVNGPRPFKFGIDTSAYRYAKYSWRHKILTKLYFLAD